MDQEQNLISIGIDRLLAPFELKKLTPDVDTSEKMVSTREVYRPGFQLTGYFDHFIYNRIMIIGKVEYEYIQQNGYADKFKLYSCDVISERSYTEEELEELRECSGQ